MAVLVLSLPMLLTGCTQLLMGGAANTIGSGCTQFRTLLAAPFCCYCRRSLSLKSWATELLLTQLGGGQQQGHAPKSLRGSGSGDAMQLHAPQPLYATREQSMGRQLAVNGALDTEGNEPDLVRGRWMARWARDSCCALINKQRTRPGFVLCTDH